jgi:hypothetical protein
MDPHKYNIVGDMDRPNGVYYLSDIEKYINDKYGIADTLYIILLLIIHIEGRYWEKVWSFPTEGDSAGSTKLQNQDLGNMEWSQLRI